MKSRASFLLATSVALLTPAAAFAASFQNPLVLKFITQILKGFVLAVIYVGTPALVVAVVWSGFLFVAAQGNPGKIGEAKSFALRVFIAGLLLLSLWAIVGLIGNTVGGLSSAALLIVLAAFFAYFLYKKG